MKKLLLAFLSCACFNLSAQTAPSTANIYDFDIGDEFHYTYPLAPPNASRMKITGKYFSAASDTVFYVRQNDNYSSVSSGGMPPSLTYYTSSFVDTIFYTNLAAPVPYLVGVVFNDSCDTQHDSLYNSSSYCGAQVYEYLNCIDCCFEGDHYNGIYAPGKGLLLHDYQNPGNMAHQRIEQRYYHKAVSNDSCGVADRSHYVVTGLSEPELQKEFSAYPNPAEGEVTIALAHFFSGPYKLQITDLYGATVYESILANPQETVNISHLASGIYFIKVNNAARKFVKL